MSDAAAEKMESAIRAVSGKYDADVFAYVGFLFEPDDVRVLRGCERLTSKRKNVLLILSTPGGSPDAAYRIARCFQRAYRTNLPDLADRGHFFIYVHDICVSAGTLLALGATKLIMSEGAQLGPIDVQLRKEDEVGERRSGLTSRQALETLAIEAGSTFSRLFRYMRFEQPVQLPTKMAGELAADMTVRMMEPIYAQLDPMRLGETERYVKISSEYGDRLRSPNVKKGTIEKLLAGYPSHEFVIDREEAEQLFESVEAPASELETIAEIIIRNNHPNDERNNFVRFISVEAQEDATEDSDVQAAQPHVGQGAARARPSRRPARPKAEGSTQPPPEVRPNGGGRVGEDAGSD
jgi:hypothetical protein